MDSTSCLTINVLFFMLCLNDSDEPWLMGELSFSEQDNLHNIDSVDFICYLSSRYLFLSHVLCISLLSAALLARAFNWCLQSLFAIETRQSYTALLPQRPQGLRDSLITHPACRLCCNTPANLITVVLWLLRVYVEIRVMGKGVVLKEWDNIEKHVI